MRYVFAPLCWLAAVAFDVDDLKRAYTDIDYKMSEVLTLTY